MNIDLTFWLLIAVLVMGGILLLNRWLSATRFRFTQEPWLVDVSRSFLPVITVVFVIRAFLIEPFQIPSGSMIPNLKIGDFILVNKFSYGIRLPILNKVIIPIDTPKRGDVMVFTPPGDERYFIKRVIGLPGDLVEFVNNQIYINGQPVEQQNYIHSSYDYGAGNQQTTIVEEQLGTHNYLAQLADHAFLSYGKRGHYRIPQKHYFMVGDNRDGSADSRSCFGSLFCNQPYIAGNPHPQGWSAVPEDNIVGKAFYIWMHWVDFFSIPSFANNGPIP